MNLNSHHWQYHVLKKNTEDVVLEMPEKDRLEMISDWCGMTRTLGQDSTLEWYNENKDKILLHPHTRLLVEIDLQELEPSSREDTNKEPSGPKE